MSISLYGLGNETKSVQKSLEAKSLANWDMIPHKGLNTLSKDELEEQIKELARQETKASSETDLKAIMLQVEKLRVQYLSQVSPDRKALYKNAIDKIGNQQDTRPDNEREKTLVDFLTEEAVHKAGKKINNDDIYAISGGSVAVTANSFGGYDFGIYAGGEMSLRMDGAHNTVQYVKTAKEQKLNEEFNRIFFNIKNATKREISGVEESGFDVKA